MSLKETKEAIAYGFAIAGLIKPELKDGFQAKDVLAIVEGLLSDGNVQKLKDALEGVEKIPAEAEGIGLFDGLELARFVIAKVKELSAA